MQAGSEQGEVRLVNETAPAIDIDGINTCGRFGEVRENLRGVGWDCPYMITEWGVNGHWECPKTDFGMPIEQTSHEKALSFDERYTYIEEDRKYCIGSYAFLWGNKQETTSTWYGLFTAEGLSSEAVDAIQKRWGSEPKNHAPSLKSIRIDGNVASDNVYLIEGDTFDATAAVSDVDGDKLRYYWSIVPESTDKRSGGDAEAAPLPVMGSLKSTKDGSMRGRVPKVEGPYRLFLFVEDGKGQVGTANLPFFVIPRPESAKQARAIEFKEINLDIPQRKN